MFLHLFRNLLFFRYLPVCLWVLPAYVSAQTTPQTSFGKNRVQYHHQFEDWVLYETPNFVTYWYGDARNVAQAALQTAELDFEELQQALEHQTLEKIEILVFQDLTDLKQSNIGEEEIFSLRSGETKVIGNKVFVYFDGNHQHLRTQVREGTAGALLNSMLFGSNLQEIVQNAVLLNLPGWYTTGLISWCGENWSIETDNQLRELLRSGRYKNFDRLAKEHPQLAGHAFWHYIALQFGRATISNLLYLTRINRSIDAGFLYVLGSGYHRTTGAMMAYFEKRYAEDAQITTNGQTSGEIIKKEKKEKSVELTNKKWKRKKSALSQIKISPDGKYLVWVSNDIGRWKVWMQELRTGKRRLLLKGGTRNALQTPDYNYPLLAWNPDNQRLAVLYERRDVPKIALIEIATRKKEVENLSPEYQRVFSIDFKNPNEMVLSAAVKGFTDLFIYRLNTHQTERLTHDFWDDLDASVVTLDGQKQILFASNRITDTLKQERLDTILPLNRFDIFLFNLETRDPELVRITNTPLFDERQPLAIDSTHFAYLSDENGIINRQTGYLAPYLAYYQTIIFLKDGAQVKASDSTLLGEWPLSRVQQFLAPLDTVLRHIDSTQIDSIRTFPIYKKRPKTGPQTNYERNILEHHTNIRRGKLVESFIKDKKTLFFQRNIQITDPAPIPITRYREITLLSAGLPVPQVWMPNQQPNLNPANQARERSDTIRTIPPGWRFQMPPHLAVTASPLPPTNVPAVESKTPLEPDSMKMAPSRRPSSQNKLMGGLSKKPAILHFNTTQIIPYRLKFRTDYFNIAPNNELLFDGLQNFDPSRKGYQPPPMGILMKANFKDLLENYVIETGVRIPVSLNGAEYYVWMDNKKHRLDRRIALYRRTMTNSTDGVVISPNQPPRRIQTRRTTLLGQYEVRYPLDVFTSIRGTFTMRQDLTDTLSTDVISLEASPLASQRAGLRLSAVYDNTVDVDLNVKTGTRAKIYVESVKKFAFNTRPDWSLKLQEGFMTVVGLDARHYQPLLRHAVLAVRLAGATSFGSERMLYYLGNIENPLLPNIGSNNPNALIRGFNQSIPIPTDGNFAFEAPANNLRGFPLNIRNGNSYALMNAELRLPIFKYIMTKKPVLGNFWRNFQLVGFFDAGSAWQGKNPYRGDNPINIVTLTNPPTVSVKVKYFRDPLVAGYGFGLRTQIFGTYVRLDYGWGIETKEIQPPMLHIGIGTDF